MFNVTQQTGLAMFVLGFVLFVFEIVIIAYCEEVGLHSGGHFTKWLYNRSQLLMITAIVLMILGFIKFF